MFRFCADKLTGLTANRNNYEQILRLSKPFLKNSKENKLTHESCRNIGEEKFLRANRNPVFRILHFPNKVLQLKKNMNIF